MATNIKATSAEDAYMNAYFKAMNQTTMANDFLGSQIFGNGIPVQNNVTSNQSIFNGNNAASSILKDYYTNSNAQMVPGPQAPVQTMAGGINMQTYWLGTQIGDMFSKNNMMFPPTTNFFKNDFLAQQVSPLLFNNGQAIA